MKRVSKVIVAVLLVCCLLSACSGGKTSNAVVDGTNSGFAPSYKTDVAGSDVAFESITNSMSSGNTQYESTESYPSYSYDSDTSGGTDVEPTTSQDGEDIRKDMLVYRGEVDISTKEYSEALQGLNELYEKYDCFIQSSQEYSNNRYYYYQDSGEKALMTYTATIRVASKDYKDFVEGATSLGVVSSKSSDVTNMNTEYSDTVTELRIYNASLERYLSLLERTTDTEYALQLEREIRDIQVTIKQLEARKNLIETDVAYSYVYLTIREVQAYSAQVSYQDPLYKRVWVEIVNTYYTFLEFLTNVLFFFIHAFPYLLTIVLIIFLVRKWFKKHKKRLPRVSISKKEKPGFQDTLKVTDSQAADGVTAPTLEGSGAEVDTVTDETSDTSGKKD